MLGLALIRGLGEGVESLLGGTIHVKGGLDRTKTVSGSALVVGVLSVRARVVGRLVSLEAWLEDLVQPEVLGVKAGLAAVVEDMVDRVVLDLGLLAGVTTVFLRHGLVDDVVDGVSDLLLELISHVGKVVNRIGDLVLQIVELGLGLVELLSSKVLEVIEEGRGHSGSSE